MQESANDKSRVGRAKPQHGIGDIFHPTKPADRVACDKHAESSAVVVIDDTG